MTEIRFTKKEAKVLDLLERNPGRIVTRKLLLENVSAEGKELAALSLVIG
jgi:DNA-binding response OmpR family regulator